MITKEQCKIEALKYNTRIEFQNKAQTFYNKSRELKIIDEICSHMILEKIDFDINKIDLLIFSPKYSNQQNLLFKIISKINEDCYNIQFEIDNLILKDINKKDIINGKVFHPNIELYKIEHRIKQFYHLIYEKAQRFKTRKEFSYYYPNEYDKARRFYKDLNNICSHMPEVKHFWKFDEVLIEAKKYQYLKDFYTKSKKAYKAAQHNNWLKEVTKHMITPDIKNMLHMVYVYEFSDNNAYIGLTRNLEKRIEIRYNDINDAVNIHINKTKLIPIIKKISDYISVEKAQELEILTIKKYKENGWNILNRKIGGGLGGYKIINGNKILC